MLLLPPLGRRLRSWPGTRAPRGARESLDRGRAARRPAHFFDEVQHFFVMLFAARLLRALRVGWRACCRSVHRLLIACCAALLLDCTLARREVPQRWSQ